MPATAPTMAEPVDLTLPFSAESAYVARERLAAWMDQFGVAPDDRDDARLVISELVGNAIRHAHPLAEDTVEVAWSAGPEGLELSVSDGGARTTPEKVHAGLSDVSGRGLSIVETLSARWWVETTRTRTTVHARISLV